MIQVSNLHCNQRLVLLLNLLQGEHFQIVRFLMIKPQTFQATRRHIILQSNRPNRWAPQHSLTHACNDKTSDFGFFVWWSKVISVVPICICLYISILDHLLSPAKDQWQRLQIVHSPPSPRTNPSSLRTSWHLPRTLGAARRSAQAWRSSRCATERATSPVPANLRSRLPARSDNEDNEGNIPYIQW